MAKIPRVKMCNAWHDSAAAIAGRSFEVSNTSEVHGILTLMSEICEACSESQAPNHLFNKLQEILEVIKSKNEAAKDSIVKTNTPHLTIINTGNYDLSPGPRHSHNPFLRRRRHYQGRPDCVCAICEGQMILP
jgi:hypothetical protein